MALNIKDTSEDREYELVPAGVHKARCRVICDTGLHSSQWGDQHKLYLNFELVETRMQSEDRRFSVGQSMTTKFGKNNSGEPSRLRGILESMRGAPYSDEEAHMGPDLQSFVNKPCVLQVMHEPDKSDPNKVWPRITGIMPAKEEEVAPLSEPPIFFSWEHPGQESELPEWLQKKLGAFPGEGVPPNAPEAIKSLAEAFQAPPSTTTDDDQIPW